MSKIQSPYPSEPAIGAVNIQSDMPEALTLSQTQLNPVLPSIKEVLFKNIMSNDILPKIIGFIEFEELKKSSTVSKKWNQFIIPFLYHSITPLRTEYIENGSQRHSMSEAELDIIEIQSCIENNEKYRDHIRHTSIAYILELSTAIRYFSTFCYLTEVEFIGIPIYEGFLENCLMPLLNLRSLMLEDVQIKHIFDPIYIINHFSFPKTFEKLVLYKVEFERKTSVIRNAMISIDNMIDVSMITILDPDLISPYIKCYPTLKRITIMHNKDKVPLGTINQIIQSNPQLEKLNLTSKHINFVTLNLINIHLNSLKILLIGDIQKGNILPIDMEFQNFMNIERLCLHSIRLTSRSIISILSQAANIKYLSIYINNEYRQLTHFIKANCIVLTNLTLLYYFSDNESVQYGSSQDSINDFYSKIEYKTRPYQVYQSVTSLILNKFNILRLNFNYLKLYPNLELLQFQHQWTLTQIRHIMKKIQKHLDKFNGWESKVFKTPSGEILGYLRRPNTRLALTKCDPKKFD